MLLSKVIEKSRVRQPLEQLGVRGPKMRPLCQLWDFELAILWTQAQHPNTLSPIPPPDLWRVLGDSKFLCWFIAPVPTSSQFVFISMLHLPHLLILAEVLEVVGITIFLSLFPPFFLSFVYRVALLLCFSLHFPWLRVPHTGITGTLPTSPMENSYRCSFTALLFPIDLSPGNWEVVSWQRPAVVDQWGPVRSWILVGDALLCLCPSYQRLIFIEVSSDLLQYCNSTKAPLLVLEEGAAGPRMPHGAKKRFQNLILRRNTRIW